MESLDATASVDQIIAQYETIALTVYITLAVIVVAIFVLGTEFWVNLWQSIWYPSLTFQRILGETQTLPGFVIMGVTGLSIAAISLSYISDEPLTRWWTQIDFENVPVLGMALTQLDSILEQVGSSFSFISNLQYSQRFAFQAQTISALTPLAFILLWLIWGLAGQLASMIAGNKGQGHGISNLWSAIPYAFMVWILIVWFFMISLHGHGFMRILCYVMILYFLFQHVVLMREHGRYNIQKAIIATIFTIILAAVIIFVLTVAVFAAAVQIEQYL